MMTSYKVKHDLYQTVLQTFYEEFDTEDQAKWDWLVENARQQGAESDDLSKLPELASESVDDWFYLYKFVNSSDLAEQDTDEWISEQNGTTEVIVRIEDADGTVVIE